MTTTKKTRRISVPSVRVATLTAWVNAENALAAFVQREDNYIEGENLRVDVIEARRAHRTAQRNMGDLLSDTVEQAIAASEYKCECGKWLRESEREAHDNGTACSAKQPAPYVNPFASKSRLFDVQIVSTEVRITTVLADDAYQAMGMALALARPNKDDVVILTWTTASEENRELTVKVLVRK